MKRHAGFHLLLLTCLATLGCGNDIPPATLAAMENAERYELLSLDPEMLENPPADGFHRWRVIERVEITDAATRQRLTEALRAGVRESDGTAASCFLPRHGIRAVRGGETHDLVICFECMQALVYRDGEEVGNLLVSRSPEPTFDAVLREASGR